MAGSKDTPVSGNYAIPLATAYAAATVTNKDKATSVNVNEVKEILDKTTDKLNTAKGIMELHPDLRLCMEIRTSMILSPKDMMFNGLRLAMKRGNVNKWKHSGEMLEFITDHLEDRLEISDKMPEYINEALFTYGANILMMLPPSSIDKYIQGSGASVSLESIDDAHININTLNLNAQVNDTLASLGITELTNNPNQLKMAIRNSNLLEMQRQQVSMESFGFNVNSYHRSREVVSLSDAKDKRENADPILFKIPVDSCLVVADPGDPSKHMFYIIQVDNNGTIATNAQNVNHFEELATRLKAAIAAKSGEEYTQLKRMGFTDTKLQNKAPSALVELYASFLERQIEVAIRDTAQGGNFKFANTDAFYRTLFTRVMRRDSTRLICVPADLVDYMAFDYDSLGHGVSLLEKTQLYSSLRAVLMFSDLMRQVTNSIPQSNLNITLDPDERDPQSFIQKTLHEFGRLSDRSIPLGVWSPATIFDELRRSGIRVNVDGGERFPNTKLEVEDTQRQIPRVETDLKEQLQRAQYAGLGVPAEAIDQTLQGDFAINTFTNNQMFAKRSMIDQRTFKALINRRIRKYILLSNTLFDYISTKLGKDEAMDFINSITAVFPEADTVRLEQQIEAYERYADFVDTAVEHHISDAILRGFLETPLANASLEEMRAYFAAYFKRRYLIKENILPELQILYTQDGENKTLIEDLQDYNKGLFASIGAAVKDLMKKDKQLEEKLNTEDDIDQPSTSEELPEP